MELQSAGELPGTVYQVRGKKARSKPVSMAEAERMDEQEGSMESNLTGWSDHKFLTGKVMVGGHAPDLQLL